MAKKAIIWDWDGVIAATFRVDLVVQLMLAMGMDVPPGFREGLAHGWGKHTIALLMHAGLSEEDARRVNDAWEAHDREHGMPFVEGAVHTVKQLARDNYVQAIVTGRERMSLELMLVSTGIRDVFVSIIAADELEYRKPDRRAFLHAFQSFRALGIVRKEEILYVGDTIVDLEAGRNAGIDTILVETGPYPHLHRESHPHPPEFIIPSAAHLPAWLDRVHSQAA